MQKHSRESFSHPVVKSDDMVGTGSERNLLTKMLSGWRANTRPTKSHRPSVVVRAKFHSYALFLRLQGDS